MPYERASVARASLLTCIYVVERVTGIEPHLQRPGGRPNTIVPRLHRMIDAAGAGDRDPHRSRPGRSRRGEDVATGSDADPRGRA
jgi:hypothetical protein